MGSIVQRGAGVVALGVVYAALITCAERTPSMPPPTPSMVVEPVASASAPKEPSPTTPGEITCGADKCDIRREVCCLADQPAADGSARAVGTCVPKLPDGKAGACCPKGGLSCVAEHNTTERHCDESADCDEGDRCCELSALDVFGESNVGVHQCVSACKSAEVCLPGATCDHDGACEVPAPTDDPVPSYQTYGRCPRQTAPPTCAGSTCEKGQSCCWNMDARRARCADQCGEDDEHVFRCTSPAQCGSYRCMGRRVAALEYRYACGDPGGWGGEILCHSAKDCEEVMYDARLGKEVELRGCLHDTDLPPGVKACRYREE